MPCAPTPGHPTRYAPNSFATADTQAVFGQVIHTYDMLQSKKDHSTQGGGQGNPAPYIDEEATAAFLQTLSEVRNLLPKLPAEKTCGGWRALPNIEFKDLFLQCCGHLMETDELRDDFLAAEAKLNSAFSIRDVVQAVKKNLKVDWTKPHREDVKAGVRSAVKAVLRKRGVKPEHLDALTKYKGVDGLLRNCLENDRRWIPAYGCHIKALPIKCVVRSDFTTQLIDELLLVFKIRHGPWIPNHREGCRSSWPKPTQHDQPQFDRY